MELSIAICDDEKKIPAYIQKSFESMLHTKHWQQNYTLFSNGFTLLKKIDEGTHFDLCFLDIEMPQIDGIALAEQITKRIDNTIIVFISAREDMVFNCFKASPLYFIRKRFFKADLEKAVPQIIEKCKEIKVQKEIVLEANNKQVRFQIRNIIYTQAEDKYLRIVCTDKEELIRYRISDLENKLESHGFIRTHKSYLVNYKYIYSIKSSYIILDDGKKLPVSRYRAEEVKQFFRENVHAGFNT